MALSKPRGLRGLPRCRGLPCVEDRRRGLPGYRLPGAGATRADRCGPCTVATRATRASERGHTGRGPKGRRRLQTQSATLVRCYGTLYYSTAATLKQDRVDTKEQVHPLMPQDRVDSTYPITHSVASITLAGSRMPGCTLHTTGRQGAGGQAGRRAGIGTGSQGWHKWQSGMKHASRP